MGELSLLDLPVKETVKVVSILSEELALQLLPMGCIPGERICIERKALFGDPILIRMEGSFLSLRKADASQIMVKKS